jgi:integrase
LKIGFLNFKNKNNQSIRYFIDFYTLFLIKILVQHLNYHKLPLKLKKTKKPFHLTAKSFNFWLEQLCNKTGITVAVTLSNLIKVAGTLSSFIFPPFIVALLKRKLDYTSFDIQIIERIKKGNYPDTIAYDKKKFTRKASIKTSSHKVKDKDIKKEIKLLHRFYTILDKNKNYSENKKKILKHVKKIKLEEHSLSFNLLIEWLLYNLSKKRKRLKISTIKEYFSGFYKDFLELTYEFSLDELDEEEIEQIIEHLFLKRFFKIYYSNPDELTSEDINLNKSLEGKSVGKIKAKIKNFFLFYKQIHNPNLNEDIFYPLEIFKGKSLVRTYLITPGEFENFLNAIKTHPRSNFLRIISSLAFYGGLRKSEILNLKFKDIVFGIEDYIYIRKSKTYSGKRKIPICYLFPDKFLNDFKKFYKDTFRSLKKEERKKKVIELKLFDNDIYNRENFLEDINFLIYALKKYFKNNKLVFHSLRHCFASWLILNFFLITRPKFRFFLLQLFENKALLGLDIYNTEKLKKFFIPNEQNLSAFALWKISMVIGHISPEETLSSYIHILEIYLGYFYWNIFQKEENFSRFFGKFNSKRIIGLIPSLNNDRSIRKAGFKRVSSGYSFIDIMKYLDKKLKL